MKNYNCEIVGKIISIEESPECKEVTLEVKHKEKITYIPIMLEPDEEVKEDQFVQVFGIICTLPKIKRYLFRVRAVKINILESEDYKNIVFGKVQVDKVGPNKSLKNSKTVKELKVHSGLDNSSFRILLWDLNAQKFENVQEDESFYIIGRIQSRDYTDIKGTFVRTYEVTVGKIEEDTDDFAEEIK